MSDESISKLLLLPGEVEIDRREIEKSPIYAIRRFLRCFDSEGQQTYHVPQHILEDLARRFLSLMDGKVNSLDSAFGGKIARQRNALEARDIGWGVNWEVTSRQEAAREKTPFERSSSTPLEYARDAVGEDRGMSDHNVRRIQKNFRRGH